MTPFDLPEILTYAFIFFSLYFEVFLLVSFLERVRQASPRRREYASMPSICVVVPCFNEARTVGTTIRSLLELEYPREKLEVLVVDDGSTDNTFEAARAASSDPRVRVLRKENGGKHSAMNLALASTSAELIGCLDADSIVDKGALKEMVSQFENPGIAAVTPAIHVREPKTWIQHIQLVEYRLGIFNRYMLASLGSLFITPGPFSIFRTSVVREIGGWRHAHSTEDMEMALRMHDHGHLIANAPRAIVHTIAPQTLRTLIKQRVRWTYGWLRNAADYRHMIGNTSYGNLGGLILPAALISIIASIYFFAFFIWAAGRSVFHEYIRFSILGTTIPDPSSFDLFYVNTSALFILVVASAIMVLFLISLGSMMSTGERRLPLSTPLFLVLYGLIAPLWLSTAVVRAVLKTGVRWR